MSLVGKKSATVVGAFFLLGVLFLVSSFLTIDTLVDYWWFDSLGYAFYFLQRLFYRYLVFLGVTALFFFIFFFNFWIASDWMIWRKTANFRTNDSGIEQQLTVDRSIFTVDGQRFLCFDYFKVTSSLLRSLICPISSLMIPSIRFFPKPSGTTSFMPR